MKVARYPAAAGLGNDEKRHVRPFGACRTVLWELIGYHSGEAVTQDFLGLRPISVNLNFGDDCLPRRPKGQEDSARGFNPGKANTTAIRPVGALDLT